MLDKLLYQTSGYDSLSTRCIMQHTWPDQTRPAWVSLQAHTRVHSPFPTKHPSLCLRVPPPSCPWGIDLCVEHQAVPFFCRGTLSKGCYHSVTRFVPCCLLALFAGHSQERKLDAQVARTVWTGSLKRGGVSQDSDN